MCKGVIIRAKKISREAAAEKGALSRLGRELLFAVVSECWGLELEEADLEKGPHGKPFVKNHPEIQFNISHSGCYAVCAVSKMPVGIDVQEHRSLHNREALAAKVLSDVEMECYARLAEEEKTSFLYDCWVEKEARVKGTGEGITRDLRSLPEIGIYRKVSLEAGYSCGVWMAENTISAEPQLVRYE